MWTHNIKYKIVILYCFYSAKQLLTCDCVSNDLRAEWITVRLGHFSSKTLDGRSSTSNSSSVLDNLPERNKPIKQNFLIFSLFFGWVKEQIFTARIYMYVCTNYVCVHNNIHHHHHYHPDLFIVGHCLDMGTCCNQSHVSWRNLRWQLSIQIWVNSYMTYITLAEPIHSLILWTASL